MSIKLFFLGCLVIFSTSLWGNDAGEFRGETKAKIEILQKQNDELKENIDEIKKDRKSVEEFKNTIDRQDKRIEDFNTLAIIIGLWAIVATFISIAVPLFFAFKWKNEAINEAREAASQWFKNNSANITNEIDAFKERLDILGNEAEYKTNHHTEKLNELEAQADEHLKYLQSQKEKSKQINDVYLQENALSQLANQLRTKSQNDYSFEDWNRLAFAADEKKLYEDAMYYWRKAIEFGKPSEAEEIQTLINIALTQAELSRFEEELVIYDDIIKRFGNTQDEESKELLAEAFLNKGIRLGKIKGREEAAIAVYTNLLKHFIDNTNETINESLSTAMLNIGFEHSKLGNTDIAKEMYYGLLKRFQICDNELINDSLAQALINLFELHLTRNEEFGIQYIDQLKNYAKNKKGILLQYKMLQIIRNSLEKEQSDIINNFKDEFHDITIEDCSCRIEDWSWEELDNWANSLEDTNVRERVIATIEQFKNWDMDSRSSRE